MHRSGRQVLEYCSLARAATRDLFRYGSPIPDKTCANECCTSTFGSFSSPQMSSCSYWKTAKSDAQTTAHDRLDRTYVTNRLMIDESFEIKVRNHNKEPGDVRVVEHLYRWITWDISAKSDSYRKTDGYASATSQSRYPPSTGGY